MGADLRAAERRLADAIDSAISAGEIAFAQGRGSPPHVTVKRFPSGDLEVQCANPRRFRVSSQNSASMFEFLDAAREFFEATGEDLNQAQSVYAVAGETSEGDLRVRKLNPPFGRPWPTERARSREPDVQPWRLGVLFGECPDQGERLPADVAARCEPRHVLDALSSADVVYHGVSTTQSDAICKRGCLGEIAVCSGRLTVAPLQFPVRTRPVVLDFPNGSWTAWQWTAPGDRGWPSAVSIGRSEAVASWALLGNPSRRIKRTPWIAFPRFSDDVLIGDASLLDGLHRLWQGPSHDLERAHRRADRLNDRVRASIQPGFDADTVHAVHTITYHPGPVVYAGLSMGGEVVVVVVVLTDITGDLQR